MKYARAPAKVAGRTPTVPWARIGEVIERPQPGQKAAVSGIEAAQLGQEVGMNGSRPGESRHSSCGNLRRHRKSGKCDVWSRNGACGRSPAPTDLLPGRKIPPNCRIRCRPCDV